jgi:hypothetical protein
MKTVQAADMELSSLEQSGPYTECREIHSRSGETPLYLEHSA